MLMLKSKTTREQQEKTPTNGKLSLKTFFACKINVSLTRVTKYFSNTRNQIRDQQTISECPLRAKK